MSTPDAVSPTSPGPPMTTTMPPPSTLMPPEYAPPPLLAKGWYPDPLDQSLRRFFNGSHWTFWTKDPATPTSATSSEASPETKTANPGNRPEALRHDIAAARAAASALLGAEKEIRLLEKHLRPEEKVVALAAARGPGVGVLACTTQRLLFLFVGIMSNHFHEVNWNQARHVIYDLRTKQFAVYTVKYTKRALPAFVVQVSNRNDVLRIAQAAEESSAAPRLDTV